MAALTSAPVPEPGRGDHVAGAGPLVTLFIDLSCPACAALWPQARELELTLCVRSFPLATRRPRGPALHHAAEAAGMQGAYFEFVDRLLADQARCDDPHLWAHVRALGLDLERFERDRRGDAALDRVEADRRRALRAGVTGTPWAFDSTGSRVAEPLAGSLSALPGAVPGKHGL